MSRQASPLQARRRGAIWLRMLVVGGLVSVLAGCFAYRSGALEKGGGLEPPQEPASRSITLLVRVKRSVNGEERETPAYLREAWIRATVEAYRASGYFTEVRRGADNGADLQAAVSIEDQVVGSPAFSYLSAMTWLLLPSRSRDQLSVETTYRSTDGEIVGQFRSKEVVTTWFQAFLLPATPFGLRDNVIKRTIEDLSRATVRTGRRKGIL